MAFGNWPVASLYRRAVYKTEFDIFKQNTDIELISLISYEDQEFRNLETCDTRPQTVPANSPRQGRREQLHLQTDYSAQNRVKRQNYTSGKELHRNIWNKSTKETEIYKDFVKTTRNFIKKGKDEFERRNSVQHGRNCKSAVVQRKPTDTQTAKALSRNQTTFSFRSKDRNRTKSAQTNRNVVSNQRLTVNTARGNCRTKSAPATGKHTENAKRSRQQNTPSSRDQKERLSPVEEIQASHNNESQLPQRLPSQRNKNGISERREKGKGILDGSDDSVSDFKITDSKTVLQGTDHESENSEELVSEDSSQVTGFSVHLRTEKERINSKENNLLTDNFPEDSNGSLIETVRDECVKSRDSGFVSNNVTPDLAFSSKSLALRGESDDKLKQVKFKVEHTIQETDIEEGELGVINNDRGKTVGDTEIERAEVKTNVHFDVSTLIRDLERNGSASVLSLHSAVCCSNQSIDGENDSLCGEKAFKALQESQELEKKVKAAKEKKKRPKSIESLVMSREARHAILETLHDMGGVRNKVKQPAINDIRHKSIAAQKRQKENRNKYEHYMRERTKSMLKNQFKSLDSVGTDENSSPYSSPREGRDCDDEDEDSIDDQARGRLFPSIRENTKLSKMSNNSNSKTHLYSLDQTKKTRYKIPGIGNYQFMETEERDFEITPPGFDSRYNARPVISNEEREEVPPRLIRERSIQKCKHWLNNVSMSPMSLQPVKR